MIGIFDSGFGGLTILKEFLAKLSEYDYMYLGDNARAPYGNKSQDLIYEYTRKAVDFLFSQGCELVILACNTASAEALRRLQKEYLPKEYPDRRVLGIIVPKAEVLVSMANLKRVGIIGTRATIESGTYEAEIQKLNPKIKIFKQACPLLVPLVEEGWADRPETKKILRKYLRPLKDKKIDALILGCTHYQILIKEIKRIMGKRVFVLNSPEIVAEKLIDYLKRHGEIEKKLGKNKKREFFITDDPKRFKEMGERFLGNEIKKIEKVEL